MNGAGPDWEKIELVAFDVDGTLYAQRPLRLHMAASLAWHSLSRGSLRTLRIIQSYRAMREEMADAETEDFETRLVRQVARRHGVQPQFVRAIVHEWIETRPLPRLGGARYPAVAQLFARVRASGRQIGILSDYPAQDKVDALGLAADHVVSADEVGLMKPHPRGLQRLMAMAGVRPENTVLIGDRVERDAMAASRAGAASMIRSSRSLAGVCTFTRYDDAVFDAVDHAPQRAAPVGKMLEII